MIVYRFQPWKIHPSRAGEFHRTSRTRKTGAYLTVRLLREDCWPGLPHLVKYRQKRRSRLCAQHARPKPREAIRLTSGPIRCIGTRGWWGTEFLCSRYFGALGGRRPPASVAVHRLLVWGYELCPF